MRMKKGTFVINPYVCKYINGKMNPLYKTMFLKKVDGTALCLTYEGKVTSYYWRDIVDWKTEGCADIESELVSIFFEK